jgi:hypothetical protein
VFDKNLTDLGPPNDLLTSIKTRQTICCDVYFDETKRATSGQQHDSFLRGKSREMLFNSADTPKAVDNL